MTTLRHFADGSLITSIPGGRWRAQTKHGQKSPPFSLYTDALSWLRERGQGSNPVQEVANAHARVPHPLPQLANREENPRV